MIRFFTGITFLYLFVIFILVWYGLVYYRQFSRNGYQRKIFPWIFLVITVACLGFLYFNIHPTGRSAAFTNLDHHFIRHDGFRAAGPVELGKSDTTARKERAYSVFSISKNAGSVFVRSAYSEEPFYVSAGGNVKLASTNFPAEGHRLSFQADSAMVTVIPGPDHVYELSINNKPAGRSARVIGKGLSVWSLFGDDTLFLNSGWYVNTRVTGAMKNTWLLQDNFSGDKGGQLKYFLSGQLYRFATNVMVDGKRVSGQDLSFQMVIPDGSMIGWGAGFPGGNKNRFRVQYDTGTAYRLLNRYPVSYPLTEEPGREINKTGDAYVVTKFLIADPGYMGQLPTVFNEGFLFSTFDGDSTTGFAPVLLSYYKGRSDAALQLQARSLNSYSREISFTNSRLLLPSNTPGLQWEFSVTDTFDWHLGNAVWHMSRWQPFMFGSLLFLFLLVFFTALLKPADRLSWVWQLLSVITMVMLTTRFFLYWRYKSFPPYEGLDLPSQQQLNNFWNFGIIILAALLLGVLFGLDTFKYLYQRLRKGIRIFAGQPAGYASSLSSSSQEREGFANKLLRRYPVTKLRFFGLWTMALLGAGIFAALNHFDASTSRHLAIVMVLVYFLFSFFSYRFSPLVAAREKSWWSIHTENPADIIISNPARFLLSVSMLAFFLFIDIGFGLVFFNFLLFNEAFLFINYGIAGLSAGSRRNASLFGFAGIICLLVFIINLIYGPYIFKSLLNLPQSLYLVCYFLFAVLMVYASGRLMAYPRRIKRVVQFAAVAVMFGLAFTFFPKERIQKKAAITKYRIDVLTMPPDKVIEKAFADGDSYEPVIRAAQNQWFINTFIYEENNPDVNRAVFHLVPHAPQNRGAKYNAQATDLVTSRFLIAEHGRWAVIFFVLLLLLPAVLLASFYKLYPDFTNRINTHYATVVTGFSVLNYLLITALLVILAATGRYIFFGQDLPFGSILSKQSVLFPCLLIILVVLFFGRLPLQRYPNRGKLIPGMMVFVILAGLLFFVKPAFNKSRDFNVEGLSETMDNYIRQKVQPLMDDIDTSALTRGRSTQEKNRLFSVSLYAMLQAGRLDDAGPLIRSELLKFSRRDFSGQTDQNKMLFMDYHSGSPQLAVNENYFHVEPPPHLQQKWAGSVYSDTSAYNVSVWDAASGTVTGRRVNTYTGERSFMLNGSMEFSFSKVQGENLYGGFCMINRSDSALVLQTQGGKKILAKGDTAWLHNPDRLLISGAGGRADRILEVQPDAFMHNYFVNGGRYYYYPMGSNFIWARNFAESISSEYTGRERSGRNIFISADAELTDSLSVCIRQSLTADTSYKDGAEYAVCIADGNGRLMAMPDYIKGYERPDPNDKTAFIRAIRGENGFIAQSELRKKTGNLNLLRLRPGPGSTLKPIVFSAVASQLPLDWDAFAAEGFSEKQEFYGGEKVSEYDFEKNNGRITNIVDYLKYSDNYYHSNVLLLGSYSKQSLQQLLLKHFTTKNPEGKLHWPYFSYKGGQYWLDGFQNWPGFAAGKANFGSDSSFVSIGLSDNYGIHTCRSGPGFDCFDPVTDSALFGRKRSGSGFVFPEYALFDQKGEGMHMDRPNEVFMSSFRGHVKGSSQVMIPPVKMVDAFGKLISQSRHYSVTLDPYAAANAFVPFELDNSISPGNFLSLMKGSVYRGMKEALFGGGTAARLGGMLKNGSPFYYYAKTGTTGDDELKTKSKLFALVISEKEIDNPDFNFRKNKFVIIYFTSQNGPAKQNEELQARVIRMVEASPVFRRYMEGKQ
ncbi:MAG: hypothetical protein U0U70_06805 [Chitinophagaceae bacterium]